MYLVTQTNVRAPQLSLHNTIEEARVAAGEACPNPGDTALIYAITKVERVSTHATISYEEFMNASSD